MGVDYYLVVPKLRTKIHVGRHVSEEDANECAEKLNKIIENNDEGKYDVEVDSINYKEITAKDMARLITFYGDAAHLLDYKLINNVLITELLKIFPDSKLVGNDSEEYSKYEKYATYQND